MIREQGVSKGRVGERLREVENEGALWEEVGGAGKPFGRGGELLPILIYPSLEGNFFPH